MGLFLRPVFECYDLPVHNNREQAFKVFEVIEIDRAQRTPEQVFVQLRNLIVKMVLKPGDRVSEQDIARTFGVSRTPVREAVIQLVNLGLLTVQPQRGTFISKLREDLLMEAVFIRSALETAVIRTVAENPDQSVIDAAQDLIARQKEAAKADNVSEFKQLDDQFHFGFAQATGYTRVGSLIEAEKAHMDRLRYLGLAEVQGEYTKVIAQHQSLLDAIIERNPTKAVKYIQEHIQRIVNIINLARKAHPDYFDAR